MARRIYSPDTVHRPTTVFSHVCIVGDVVYLAGQAAHTVDNQEIDSSNPPLQFRQIFHDIGLLLESAGASYSDIVRLMVYLRRDRDIPLFSEIAQEFLGEHRPAVTLTMVKGLASPEYLVEIDTIAVRPGAGD